MAKNKYSHGKIYKMCSDIDDKFYIGSTTLPLKHEYDVKKYGSSPMLQHFRDIGWSNVRIELLEEFPCVCKHELDERWRYWIDVMNPMLSMRRTTKKGTSNNP